jgi:hypothetical protein
VAGGAVIHKLAAAAVPAWEGPLRKLMNNYETDIRAQERTAEKMDPARQASAAPGKLDQLLTVPGVPLRSTPGYNPGAPSALKSKCLSHHQKQVKG